MPSHPYVAGPDRIITGRVPKAETNKHEYVQVNPRDLIFNMIFDLDADKAVEDWYDNIPFLPAYFVGKRRRGKIVRPHAIVKLRNPVDLRKWSQACLYYAIRQRLQELLTFGDTCILDDGDKVTTKNPNCGHWDVVLGEDRLWTLHELRDVLQMAKPDELDKSDMISVYRRAGNYFDADKAKQGRHCMLFESMRGLAYMHKKNCASQEELFQYVYREAIQFDAMNNRHSPLKPSQIKATARSIAKWTWRYFTGHGHFRDINFGVCRDLMRPGMTLRQRQAIGGKYGAEQNASRHQRIIESAMQRIPDWTVKGLARELKMAINTVRKHARAILEIPKIPLEIIVERLSASGGSIQCHQNSAGVGIPRKGRKVEAKRDGRAWIFVQEDDAGDWFIDEHGCRVPFNLLEPWIISP